jgi:hypothetical protein
MRGRKVADLGAFVLPPVARAKVGFGWFDSSFPSRNGREAAAPPDWRMGPA